MIQRIFQPKFEDDKGETIWLTIYADLTTTLMMLFLALFGLTVIGDKALKEAIMSMNIDEITKMEEVELDELEMLTMKLKKEFIQIPALLIVQETGKARITFGASVLFKSGEAKLRRDAVPVMKKLSEFLKTVPYTIVVEGHTDSLQLTEKADFDNNWELSLARSMTVVRIFEKFGLGEGRVAAAAYGPTRPTATNVTSVGRSQNRRVEVTVLKDYPYNKPKPKENNERQF